MSIILERWYQHKIKLLLSIIRRQKEEIAQLRAKTLDQL